MIAVGLGLAGTRGPASARVCWIRDTLRLGEVLCSTAHLGEARGRDDLEVVSEPAPMPLDDDGNLPDDLPAG
jgi:hypothetical protein